MLKKFIKKIPEEMFMVFRIEFVFCPFTVVDYHIVGLGITYRQVLIFGFRIARLEAPNGK